MPPFGEAFLEVIMIGASLNNQQYSFEADSCMVDIKMTEAVASTPVVARGSRAVSGITNAVTGEYIITLRHGFTTFLGATFTLLDTSDEDFIFKIEEVDLSAKTISFTALIAGTPTDIDTDAELYINLRLGMSSVNMG